MKGTLCPRETKPVFEENAGFVAFLPATGSVLDFRLRGG
jgi:hypothetical protein